ncbi:MAG: LLM class flavin-dependent oxidoreductase [Nitrososphaerota archaeon]|nr:LLM class flavin-dependent oxidoreductase [Candidatus Calditenuaceae archaeon]MDW8073834.1 LLM class flavin-dependent oxidoreductase [Nitrososphaerota archaeon]
MKYSLEVPPKDPVWRLQIYANLADSLSFETVWLSDHYYNRSIAVAATAMATVMKRRRIGLGIMNPYLHHPVLMAQMAASLSELAPDRVSIGIGAGDKNALESLGIVQESPVERVRWAVKTVRELLISGRREGALGLDFGAWGRIPIYVAAQGPRMLRLAAEVGDGVLINTSWLPSPSKPIGVVKEALESAGRSREEFSVEMEVLVSVHEEAEKARKTVKPYVGVVVQGLSPEMAAELGIREEMLRQIGSMVKARMWLEIHKVVPDSLVELFSIAGSPRDVSARLEDVSRAGLGGLVLGGPLGPTPRRAMIMLDGIVKGLSE